MWNSKINRRSKYTTYWSTHLVYNMFEMSAFFMFNEVQKSFHVFGNSLESTFVYDSNCFSNFCLQFINIKWSIPVYNVLSLSPEILVTGSRVWGAQATKSVHPFQSIVQEALCSNILVLRYNSARLHRPVRGSCFVDSLEAWETRNTEVFFHLLPITFPSSK